VFVVSFDARVVEGVEAGGGSNECKPTRAVLVAVTERVYVSFFVVVSSWLCGDGDVFVDVCIDLPAGGDLSHSRATEDGLGGLFGMAQGWEEDADEDGNDGDDY